MFKTALSAAALATAFAGGALAADPVKLKVQTHYAPETPSGKLAAVFADDVKVMSGGSLELEIFFSSSVVKTVETFDAAATGVLDCDMTGGGYQTGKNPGFQFVGDIMGGYDTPWQQYGWLYNGGYEQADALYAKHGMKLVGWWIYGQEALSSTKPITGVKDLKDWKFRSPPGLETEIFAKLGAKPTVMDFQEIFTALETGIIDGADASALANNVGLGLYDIAKHATFPGFHSMPSDHLACRKDKWDSLTDAQKRIMEVAMQKLGFQTSLTFEIRNLEAAGSLAGKGVTIHNWSQADRDAFRAAALSLWDGWAAKTPEAKALVESHRAFMAKLGLIK